jgi:hypothetical protein
MRRRMRNATCKDNKLEFYKIVALPKLYYGCDTYVVTTNGYRSLEVSEMKFLRDEKTYRKGNKIRNADVELDIFSINVKNTEHI